MEHQDWKPVILRKKIYKPPPQKPPKNTKFHEIDGDNPKAPPTLDHSVKIRIQQARVAKKLTQKQLAQKLNLPVNTINDYESGKAVPNRQILSKIGRALGINLNKQQTKTN